MAAFNGQAAFQSYVDPAWMSLSPSSGITETSKASGDGWTIPPFEARILALSSSMVSSEAQNNETQSQLVAAATRTPSEQDSAPFPSSHDPQEAVVTNAGLLPQGLPSHGDSGDGDAQNRDQGQDPEGWQPGTNAQFPRPLWLQALQEAQITTLSEEQPLTTPADEATQESVTASSWWDELRHSQIKQESLLRPNLLTAFTSPGQDTDSSSFLSSIVDDSSCQPYCSAASTVATRTDPSNSIQPAWSVSRMPMQRSTTAAVQDNLLQWPDSPATARVDAQYPPSSGLELPFLGDQSLSKVRPATENSRNNASIRETSDFSHESLSTTSASPNASIPAHTTSDSESNKRRPAPPRKRNVTRCPKKDALLLEGKRLGLSYKEIKRRGGFEEAESTLRGRYRSITKRKEERVRRPQWQPRDIELLREAVRVFSMAEPGTRLTREEELQRGRVSWKNVSAYIYEHGGSYRFGNSTCKKKWAEVSQQFHDDDS